MPARQKPSKQKPSKQKRARQFQDAARAGEAALETGRRKICSALLFWKFCGGKECLRARACAGDVGDCFARLWPHVPEDLKFTVRSFIKASGSGRSQHEIEATMEHDRQRRRETQAAARAAEAGAQAVPREPSPATVRAAPGAGRNPRLSVL